MKVLSKRNSDGNITIEDVPVPNLKKGFVLVKNIFSSMSIGTEKASIQIAKKNLIEKSRSRPEDLKKVIDLMKKVGVMKAYQMAMDKLELPSPLGYSSAGIVIKTSPEVRSISVGDRVACGGSGHAEIISVPENLCVRLSPSVSLEEASHITISSIALQGIRQSKASLGDYVLVIGLGLVGIITMKLLKAAGCIPVGVDISEEAINYARGLSFTAFNSKNGDINSKLKAITAQGGFDNAIITASSSSSSPMNLATDVLRDRGAVTVVGDIPLEASRAKFYDKELSLNLSRSYGAGRYDSNYENKGLDYPIGYVKWTERRNMKAINDMLAEGTLTFQDMRPSIIKFKDSVEAFSKLEKGENEWFSALIKYPNSKEVLAFKTKILSKRQKSSEKIGIGVIGTGSYAQNILLPILSNSKRYDLIGVCSNDGSMVNHVGSKYSFKYVTTKSDKIFSDEEIELIFILTRHDSHSDFVVQALQNGKDIFVEKPLSINLKELETIEDLHSRSENLLMVGFNRRFSSSVIKCKEILKDSKLPIHLNYTINAGELPQSHWLNDSDIGGGRLVGEGCHFVDLCNFLVEDLPVKSSIHFLRASNSTVKDDSFVITLSYQNNSVAVINYLSNTSPVLSKEIININFGNNSMVIDDFKDMLHMNGNSQNSFSSRSQDKGQKAMIESLADSFMFREELINSGDIFTVSNIVINLRDTY